MPLIDMPLEKLKTYDGTNPCPSNFDAYWDRGLAEMAGTRDNIELTEAAFQTPNARCQDLYFTGVKGARVHAKLLTPKNASGRRPAVLFFHGYTGSAGDWSNYLGYVGAGFVVAALDCRGQGGMSEDTGAVKGNTHHGHIIRGLDGDPDQLLFRQIFLDTAQLARIVMGLDSVDPDRVGATGGSQGGGLTLACTSLVPGIKRSAPRIPFLSDYQRVWEMDLAKGAYAELKEYFRHFDPTHANETGVFTRLGYIDVHNLAPRIQANTLMLTGLVDEICPPSTQFAAYNRIRGEKSMVIYPDFGHENLPGGDDLVFSHLLEL